jgi:molecular chaperone DnaK (HSP70)/uncharacterized protein YegL
MWEVTLGIDLGTTFSCVAYVDEKGDMNLVKIGNEISLPSVVRIVNGKVEVGQEAMNQWIIDSEHVVRWVKRSMGDPAYLQADTRLFDLPDDWAGSLTVLRQAKEANERNVVQAPETLVKHFADQGIALNADPLVYEIAANLSYNIVGGCDTGGYCIRKDIQSGKWSVSQGWSAVAISAEILKELKRHAEEKLGRPVSRAVITCPAWFNANEIEATFQAGVRAGFQVGEIIKEPVAAGVYHAAGKLSPGKKLLVCDLGGGTFDATIIEVGKNDEFKPTHTRGDRQLGGHDWTEALKTWMAAEYLNAHKEDLTLDPQSNQSAYTAAEEAKRAVAKMPKYAAALRGQTTMGTVVVERATFESLTSGLMQRVTERLKALIAEANMPWGQVDEVLLVGGSSRLLAYQAAVAAETGHKPVVANDPDLVVAYGAAALAAGQFRPKSTGGIYKVNLARTVPRNMGTRAFDEQTGKVITVPMLSKGLKLPIEHRDDGFAAPGDPYVDIPVVEFEDADASKSFECIKSYRCVLDGNVSLGDQLEVCFKYDRSARISVQSRHVKSGRQLAVEVHPFVEPTGDGHPTTPWTVLFALDISYSMDGDKLDNAKQALGTAARQVLSSSGAKAGVVTFGSAATVLCPQGQDADAIVRKIDPVECSGSTNMSGALAECRRLLEREPGGTDREVILLTDGMPDEAMATLREAQGIVSAGIKLSVLSIEGNVDEDFLEKMTRNIVKNVNARDLGKDLKGMLKRRR